MPGDAGRAAAGAAPACGGLIPLPPRARPDLRSFVGGLDVQIAPHRGEFEICDVPFGHVGDFHLQAVEQGPELRLRKMGQSIGEDGSRSSRVAMSSAEGDASAISD